MRSWEVSLLINQVNLQKPYFKKEEGTFERPFSIVAKYDLF